MEGTDLGVVHVRLVVGTVDVDAVPAATTVSECGLGAGDEDIGDGNGGRLATYAGKWCTVMMPLQGCVGKLSSSGKRVALSCRHTNFRPG